MTERHIMQHDLHAEAAADPGPQLRPEVVQDLDVTGQALSAHKSDAQRTVGADLIPESVVRRVSEDRRAEAELALVTNLLKDVPELRLDPSAKVSDYIDGLVKRRAELLKRDRPASTGRTRRSQPIDSVIMDVGPFFSPWIAVNLPPFTEGVDDTPGVAGTSGDYTTDALLPGGVEFEGEPHDSGTVQPDTDKWWSHNWIGSYVFPQASQDSWLYYRFTTQTNFELFNPTAQAAAVILYTNVSTISDVGTGSLFGPAATLTVDWPFWVTLPTNLPAIDAENVLTPISGSIQVHAGQTPAIGFIYGISTGLDSGDLLTLGASLQTQLSAGTTYQGNPSGLIEYRYEPDWWVVAVGQRQNGAANAPAKSS
jgi:hypothetical protein